MRKTGKTGKSNRMRQEASYMAAKEQLTAMEMIWGFMSGTTGHMGKTDFAPQKEAFGDFASPETYFPRVTPESEGISSEKLTQMIRELAAARHTDMHHLLVLRNGQVICECNFAPYRSGIWHATYSMCKSITGMAVGFLISEGKLSLDENVYDIFEKRNGLLQKILRPNLTVEHLLTMKSGVQFNEMGVVSGNDWVDSFLNAPVKGTPGEAFEYNSMNTYLLSAIIQERTGMKMVDYLRPRLFEPLGIRKVFWESCPAGITKGGWGLFLCPEDAAKLGVMYVNGGKFEGKQIVPAEWVAASTSVHATPPEKMGKYGYGYQVWMEERPGSFAFNGMLGQNVLGYPDTGVVIVTNAGSNELFQTCEMLDIVRKYFGAEFGAELKSGEAESPMAYQKLVQTCRDLEGAKETPGRILRGGWKRRTPGPRNSGTPRQIDMAQLLHGKEYKMEDTHVGMFPLTLQVFHNNFSDGIRRIGFFYEKGRFFVELTEGEKTQRIAIGLTGSKVVEWVENEESYLLGTTGQFAENEDGELVLKLEFAFLEEAARRKVKIIFRTFPDNMFCFLHRQRHIFLCKVFFLYDFNYCFVIIFASRNDHKIAHLNRIVIRNIIVALTPIFKLYAAIDNIIVTVPHLSIHRRVHNFTPPVERHKFKDGLHKLRPIIRKPLFIVGSLNELFIALLRNNLNGVVYGFKRINHYILRISFYMVKDTFRIHIFKKAFNPALNFVFSAYRAPRTDILNVFNTFALSVHN